MRASMLYVGLLIAVAVGWCCCRCPAVVLPVMFCGGAQMLRMHSGTAGWTIMNTFVPRGPRTANQGTGDSFWCAA
ncbi:hypothetical protein COO60DRAFT_1516413 [Scenedesmus sp. NREL 46B-D3]|nr:hypothetical protein COO60DRAFT_1516413 [Scenedesmus sp. NREL 46B-D3]